MGTIVNTTEHQINNLLLGHEIGIIRKWPREYAATFAHAQESILLRYQQVEYAGVVTARVDKAIDKYEIEMILKVKLV